MLRPDLRDISGSPRGPLLLRRRAWRSSGGGCGRGRRERGWDTGRMSDSLPAGPATPVLDVWCELQCPDCRTALDDLRALRARYGERLELRLRH
ncbi:DsbA family protein, partial [Streptomyces sp. TRM76130]|nr:DsbA family protein [Streptomyces sp. TRM76130]